MGHSIHVPGGAEGIKFGEVGAGGVNGGASVASPTQITPSTTILSRLPEGAKLTSEMFIGPLVSGGRWIVAGRVRSNSYRSSP